MIELVLEFVDGFGEQPVVQQEFALIGIGRKKIAFRGTREVGAEIFARGGAVPRVGERDEQIRVRLRGAGAVEQGGVGCIVKRPNHAGYIAKGRMLFATLGEGARGFAFEIDEDEVAASEKHLAKMQIAVNARTEACEFAGAERSKTLSECCFRGEYASGDRPSALGQIKRAPAEHIENAVNRGDRGLGYFQLFGGREWFRREVRIVAIGSERRMQFGRALTEERSFRCIVSELLRVEAYRFRRRCRRGYVGATYPIVIL